MKEEERDDSGGIIVLKFLIYDVTYKRLSAISRSDGIRIRRGSGVVVGIVSIGCIVGIINRW